MLAKGESYVDGNGRVWTPFKRPQKGARASLIPKEEPENRQRPEETDELFPWSSLAPAEEKESFKIKSYSIAIDPDVFALGACIRCDYQ